MKYYLILQIVRIKRWFRQLGIHPWIGAGLMLLLFIALSKALFFKTEFAKWIYPALALTILARFSSKSHIQPLKLLFNTRDRKLIRCLENGICTLPFIFFLLLNQQFFIAAGLFVFSMLMALFALNHQTNWTVPTPFKKIPFEFIIGFRKTFLFIFFLYFLVFKGIQVDNYQLSLFGLALLFFLSMSFYTKPESSYFVWIFSCKSVPFIRRKLLDALFGGVVLVGPALICLFVFFQDKYLISLLVFAIGIVFLLSMILAKYSAFPHEINLPQGILYTLSLWFPPMLLIVIPLFFKQSKPKLDTIL